MCATCYRISSMVSITAWLQLVDVASAGGTGNPRASHQNIRNREGTLGTGTHHRIYMSSSDQVTHVRSIMSTQKFEQSSGSA